MFVPLWFLITVVILYIIDNILKYNIYKLVRKNGNKMFKDYISRLDIEGNIKGIKFRGYLDDKKDLILENI